MKMFILGLIFLSANAFAQESGSVFQLSSVQECNQSCLYAELEAIADLTSRADARCSPAAANRISDWQTNVTGYGRLTTTAIFSCEKENKSVFQISGAKECGLDCLQAEIEAMADAKARAEARCSPLAAKQISNWNTDVTGYGRLITTAVFSCQNEQANN
ncbi:MAG: hypothetical protein V4596_09570 [Bdellovibrionota bacterium]